MIRPIFLLPAMAVLLALAPPADAQVVPLDDVWLRLRARSSGYAVDATTLDMKKASLKAKAFLHLTLAEGSEGAPDGATYAWELWTKQDGGVWGVSDSGQHTFVGPSSSDQLAVDLVATFVMSEGRFFTGRGTFYFNLKLGKDGFLKKVKLRTLGGETIDGLTGGQDFLAGRFVLKGHRVKVGKLPFDPGA
jgi:hypothetical protein